jgi:hypothetical protein
MNDCLEIDRIQGMIQPMNNSKNQSKWIKSEKGQAYLKSEARKESIRKYNRVRDREYRDKVQAKVREIKLKTGCKSCGFNFHSAALEFHHREPEKKKFRLSESRNYSIKAVMEEISKCGVMCANCHAILEYNKRNGLIV